MPTSDINTGTRVSLTKQWEELGGFIWGRSRTADWRWGNLALCHQEMPIVRQTDSQWTLGSGQHAIPLAAPVGLHLTWLTPTPVYPYRRLLYDFGYLVLFPLYRVISVTFFYTVKNFTLLRC